MVHFMKELLSRSSAGNSIAPQVEIILVTGYSGAGKSVMLRALEDIGFFCIDNLPVQLLPSLFQFIANSQAVNQRIALGIDARGGHTMEYLIQTLNRAHEYGLYTIKIFFLSASSAVLCKRFQETRRAHPMGKEVDLITAIELEKKLLQPLVESAHTIVETDQFTLHELRNFVRISCAEPETIKLIVNIISFGFKYGIPQESNMIYDVRFLPNPYFVEALRPLTGKHILINDYLFSHTSVTEYWDKLIDFFKYSVQKSYEEGRSFITIALGCTGGRHRSVALVEKIAQVPIEYVQFMVKHRDINQDPYLLS